MSTPLESLSARLLAHYGSPRPSGAGSPLEAIVAAILCPDGNWQAARIAIDKLRDEGLLAVETLARMPLAELAEIIRSAGHVRAKAARLHRVMAWLLDRYAGSPEAVWSVDHETVRSELLAINGLGFETADALLLYARGVPRFVVDRHAHRVFKRHGWIDWEADYHALQQYVENSLPADPPRLAELRALLARVGRDYCGTIAACDACPLADLLPPGGARPMEG